MGLELTFPPRMMKQNDAAAYLGVSVPTLHKLPIPRKTLAGMPRYDRMDLDAFASSLPIEDGEENTCDELFASKT